MDAILKIRGWLINAIANECGEKTDFAIIA